jgi:hypothetical protein
MNPIFCPDVALAYLTTQDDEFEEFAEEGGAQLRISAAHRRILLSGDTPLLLFIIRTP